MAYFIRSVGSQKNAHADLERGYSFREYQFFVSEDDARESDFVEYYGIDPDTIESFDVSSGEPFGFRADVTTLSGFALDGLCGFQSDAETLDDAIEDAKSRSYAGGGWPCVAVYTGRYCGQTDGGDGDMFIPQSLEVVIER
jgi:hypothetical protein